MSRVRVIGQISVPILSWQTLDAALVLSQFRNRVDSRGYYTPASEECEDSSDFFFCNRASSEFEIQENEPNPEYSTDLGDTAASETIKSTETAPSPPQAQADEIWSPHEDENYERKRTLRSGKRIFATKLPRCDECNRTFTTTASLKQHINLHTGQRPFVCDFCGLDFAQRTTLRTHRRLHTGEMPYKCGKCDKRFRDLSTFTRHRRTHTGERPYNCTVCDRSFSQSGNLERHTRTFH